MRLTNLGVWAAADSLSAVWSGSAGMSILGPYSPEDVNELNSAG
jgi:hypothetical protein